MILTKVTDRVHLAYAIQEVKMSLVNIAHRLRKYQKQINMIRYTLIEILYILKEISFSLIIK